MTMSEDFDIHEWRLYQANLTLLNEEEDDFDITTDSFDVVELGIGDIITPDMWDKSSGDNFFFDEPIEIIDYEEEDDQIYFYLKDSNSNILAVDLYNSLKPKYQVVLPLDESDDDWNITLGKEWEFEELGIGDIITHEMWKDPEWNYYTRKGNVEITDFGYDDYEDYDYVILADVNNEENWQEYELGYVNNMLKYPYQIVQPLTEQEDNDWDLEVGDNWNNNDLGEGDVIEPDMWDWNAIEKWVAKLHDNDHEGYNIEWRGWKSATERPIKILKIFDEGDEDYKYVKLDSNSIAFNMGPSLIFLNKMLKDGVQISDGLFEQQNDDFDIKVSDKWNETELNVGDTITPDMWDMGKVEVESDSIIRDKEWFKNPHKITKFRETTYIDIIVFDGKKELSKNFVEKYLKDNFKINFYGLNESDNEWDFEVGSNWNEFEGEFVLTYKVEDEGYVYVYEDDIKEFQRLNPGVEEFDYNEEPIRLTTTYKSKPVDMKYFISNYENNTGHTLSPYTEEPTTEGFKKWLKDNNWDNEEFVFLHEIFSPTRVKEEYYDYRENPVRITDKMKKRMDWLDDVTGVEVLNVKFLG